jgi:hypothetical protein
MNTPTIAVTLGATANVPCPKCGRAVAFFTGDKDAFISEVRHLASHTFVQLECQQHGMFEVRAGDFRDRLD